MKKYKILLVTPFFPPEIGGISIHVSNLIEKLALKGNEISVITPLTKKKVDLKISKHCKKVYSLPSFFLPGWPYPTLKSVSIPKNFGSKIEEIIKNGDFDLVHAHGHHYPFSWYSINAARKFNLKTILTLHGIYALNPNVLGGKTWIEEQFNKYFFTKLLSKCDAVIGLTQGITNHAKKYGSPVSKYYTIPNGVNISRYTENISKKYYYKEQLNLNKKNTIILFRGRFERIKGALEFTNAALRLVKDSNIEVLIVGQGTLETEIKNLVKDSNRIHVLDWLPNEKIHEIDIASDIFVLPSRSEALPITILEVMNASLHIISTRVGGLEEILKPYNAKSYLDNVSKNEIVSVLLDSIKNIQRANEISKNHARSFDWNIIADRILKVYQNNTT